MSLNRVVVEACLERRNGSRTMCSRAPVGAAWLVVMILCRPLTRIAHLFSLIGEESISRKNFCMFSGACSGCSCLSQLQQY